jgi:hypothetical protein
VELEEWLTLTLRNSAAREQEKAVAQSRTTMPQTAARQGSPLPPPFSIDRHARSLRLS